MSVNVCIEQAKLINNKNWFSFVNFTQEHIIYFDFDVLPLIFIAII